MYNGSRVGQVARGGTEQQCCASCTELPACWHYSWHPLGSKGQETFCEHHADDGAFVASNPTQRFAAGSVTKHVYCHTEMDCSLAGECVDGACVCDGWTHGAHCEILNLEPAQTAHLGYHNSSGWNSWGGASIEFDGQWYLFASQIKGKCPLAGYWDGGSEAVRGVSEHPMGPFDEITTVIPNMAHNIKPFRAPDGTFLIFYVGEPYTGSRPINCVEEVTSEAQTPPHPGGAPSPEEAAGPVMIASSMRPDAPAEEWQHHGPITDSVAWHSATNPSPIFYENGTVLLAVSRRWKFGNRTGPGSSEKNTFLMRADHWRGPYRNITTGFSTAIETGEDPDIFRTARGYHMLNHNTGPGSTVMYYSPDGLEWHRALGENAFNMSIQWDNGSTTTVCSRQRPQVVLNNDSVPTWFWSGVGVGPPGDCGPAYPTWTLAQRIGFRPPPSKSDDAALVKFNALPYGFFRALDYLPLPYGEPNTTWAMVASCCGQANSAVLSAAAVVNTSRHYQMLTPTLECAGASSSIGGTNVSAVGEWGYEFEAFDSVKFASSPCVDKTLPSLAMHGTKPSTKAEALEFMNAYYDCRLETARHLPGAADGIFNLIGHYFYAALGVQRGHTAVVASEIQENINSIQAHFALTRGAARQYHIPWAIDVSPWFAGLITDYSKARPWHASSGAGGNGGHSVSLFKRSWWLSYLSGCNQLIIEAGGVNLFFENTTDDGFLSLSPLGDEAVALAKFIRSIPERAIPYVPVSIVLEHAHGFGLGLVDNDAPLAWNQFPLTGSDEVAWGLLQNLWPGSWKIEVHGSKAENNYLVPSPYGDTFDVLAEEHFTSALDLYRVVMTAGNVSLGSTELAALRTWVAGGGTSVVFASQLAADATSFVGAKLGATTMQPRVASVRDAETGWMNATTSGSSATTKPFCASQSAKANSAWYIKTGGDPATATGWGKGAKCCRSTRVSCHWYATKEKCTAALNDTACLPCTRDEASGIGCPRWGEPAP